MRGKVYLVGCGPGAADLLTLRAVETLENADVILYDRLVDERVLDHAKNAKKIPCGKKPGEPLKQGWINRRLYSEARKGKVVVRLKNGDPMVFGRGGEELQFLLERGVDVEVVPGLSSAISVPALAKIPLTQRGVSSSLTILTGHRAEGKKLALPGLGDTVVVLMAVKNLETVVRQLVRSGKSGSTPCALISDGATEKERVVVSTLGRLCDISKRLGIGAPAVLVVGKMANSLLDFKGRTVTTFRAKDEIKRTELLIKRACGIPNVFEICEIAPAKDALKIAAERKWDTLVFTSASGVRSAAGFFNLKRYRLIAIGETTCAELKRRGCRGVLVPPIQNLDGVGALLKKKDFGRVLAFRSPLAEEKLEGATNIVAYRVIPKNLPNAVRSYINTKSDFTLLTSSGLLELLLKTARRLGLEKNFVKKINLSFVISLGGSLTNHAVKNKIKVNYEPEQPNIDSLFKEAL